MNASASIAGEDALRAKKSMVVLPAKKARRQINQLPAPNTRAVQATGSRRVNRASNEDDEMESVRIEPGELAESMRATMGVNPPTANLLHSRAK